MFFYESDDVSFDFCRGLAIPFSKSPKWFQFRASTLFAIPVWQLGVNYWPRNSCPVFGEALKMRSENRGPFMVACQMATARFLDCMYLALRASGLWLRYATLQNLIPSFAWIAPPMPPTLAQSKERRRDQILPSGNLGPSLSLPVGIMCLLRLNLSRSSTRRRKRWERKRTCSNFPAFRQFPSEIFSQSLSAIQFFTTKERLPEKKSCDVIQGGREASKSFLRLPPPTRVFFRLCHYIRRLLDMVANFTFFDNLLANYVPSTETLEMWGFELAICLP